MRQELIDDLVPLIEKHVTAAFESGFNAGLAAGAMPWQNLSSAPLDGTSILLSVGVSRSIGYFNIRRKAWVQAGTGKELLPLLWCHIPALPKQSS
jgi:hypothetical protein